MMFDKSKSIPFYKKSKPQLYSSLFFLDSSYRSIQHRKLHPSINSDSIKENGFLVSNSEKERLLGYMAFHEGAKEIISSDSPLMGGNQGAVFVNREHASIYKMYHPETSKDKNTRKFLEKWFSEKIDSPNVLGKGGKGKVRIVQNLISGKYYAVKIIKKNLLEQLASIMPFNCVEEPSELYFLKEKKLFVDFFESYDKFYIIQKLIKGTSPDSYIQSIHYLKNSIPCLFKIFNKMLIELAKFHSKGFLHRDISPHNFIYNSDPEKEIIYLIDFDAAIRLREGKDSIYEEAGGKKGYMAPEVIDKGRYSFASDIYALGKSFEDILKCVPQKLSKKYDFVDALEDLIQSMMHIKRSYRPHLTEIQNALSLIENQALEELQNEFEQDAKDPLHCCLL